MATRIGFFGKYDVSFSCGAGHWREALHSGRYGHNARMPDIDLHSQGSHILAPSTLPTTWLFRNYNEMLFYYSQRTLSYESDKVNAIPGCLDILGRNGEVKFFAGMPSVDFHYALLWYGEYDERREGFPSWSWAGWHAEMQVYFIVPNYDPCGCLSPASDGNFEYTKTAPSLINLGADFLPKPYQSNQCSQNLAIIHLSQPRFTVTVESQVARFFVDIKAEPNSEHSVSGNSAFRTWQLTEKYADLPAGFETNSDYYSAQWNSDLNT